MLSIPSAALRDSAMEYDPCCMTTSETRPVHTGLEAEEPRLAARSFVDQPERWWCW
jgi:hypothetical protein